MDSKNDKTPSTSQFDVDAWAKLHKEDPAAFEEKRLAWIESTITQASEANQRRLRGLQFQIDGERQKAKNQTDCFVKLSKMMFEQLAVFKDALEGKMPEAPKTKPAKVLDLSSKLCPETAES